MNVYQWLGGLLGLEQVQNVTDYKFSFAAAWAQRAPLLLLLGLAGLVAAAAWFYFRHQPNRHRGWRFVLFLVRAAVLCQVLLLLTEPILTLTIQSKKRPALWLLFDGTDSMNIADDLPRDVREATNKSVGISIDPPPSPGEADSQKEQGEKNRLSRVEYLRALITKKDQNLLEHLSHDFRLQAFLFESTPGVRSLELSHGQGPIDGKHLAEQLSANGQVTDLGGAINDLSHRNPPGGLAGLMVFSDFENTTGPSPANAARQFGAKIYAVGVGATRAVNLTATIVAEPLARVKDDVAITVVLQPTGAEGLATHVRLFAEAMVEGVRTRTAIGEKETPPLTGVPQKVQFTFKPEKPGLVHIVAEIDRLPGEVNREKNVARGQIEVLDDYLRLMFVEYEPTWEWRFIKEVFYRDPLVGMKGFRTFLYSSDPQVRRNELFLASMAPSREEFFKNDLIFLGDMPASALSDHFCGLVKEFVGRKGGGLVILSGPRFGPQQLAKTQLADLLPVSVDPTAPVRDKEPVVLQLTPQAAEYPFMQLGGSASLPEMQHAWDALGPLPWYQPVEGVRPSATVLAEHPTALCAGGRKQPLIAIRPYGSGEVVYLAFNETWRLRRAHGEELFRRFWKEVMSRLALKHALGENKRFVVQTQQPRYRVDETVTVNVMADDAQYKALSENAVPGGKLTGEWVLPAVGAEKPLVQKLSLTQVEPGLFSTHFVVTTPGEHRVNVIDPITHKPKEATFTAYSTSVERQSPVRNKAVQEAVAADSGGVACDLKDVDTLLSQIQPSPRTETSVEVVSLVNTWGCFLVVAGLLFVEWVVRKGIGLP